MPKVLVLCQRRSGEETEGVHEAIERLSRHLLGDDVKITYLSSNTGYTGEVAYVGETDMSFVFGHNEKTDQLARDYDLIINHQCPAPEMNYKRIHLHLKEGGHLAVASYNKEVAATPESILLFLQKNGAFPMIKEAGFEQVDLDPTYNTLLFRKVGDHTDYFKTTPYETSVYDPDDQSEETNAKRSRMKPVSKPLPNEVPCDFTDSSDSNDQLQRILMKILLDGRDLEEVKAQARAQACAQSREPESSPVAHVVEASAEAPADEDDLYSGGMRKRTAKRRKTRYMKKWSMKYKKRIDCKRPKGFSQKQHCKYGRTRFR